MPRVSCIKGDPGYTPHSGLFYVTFNGMRQEEVHTADEEIGTVHYYYMTGLNDWSKVPTRMKCGDVRIWIEEKRIDDFVMLREAGELRQCGYKPPDEVFDEFYRRVFPEG